MEEFLHNVALTERFHNSVHQLSIIYSMTNDLTASFLSETDVGWSVSVYLDKVAANSLFCPTTSVFLFLTKVWEMNGYQVKLSPPTVQQLVKVLLFMWGYNLNLKTLPQIAL